MKADDVKAWGQVVVSVFALTAFTAALLVAWMTKNTELMASLGNTIQNVTIAVVGYWVGSSIGSSQKDGQLERAQAQLAASVPASVAQAIVEKGKN